MADSRFFRARGPYPLGDLAARAGATLGGGDPALPIEDVAPLNAAGPRHLAFLDNRKYRDQARSTRAAACLIREDLADLLPPGVARLLTADPYRAYARIAAAFHPEAAAPGPDNAPEPDVARTAFVDPAARLGPDCRVAPGAVILAGAELGPRCRIGANAVVGEGVVLGEDCVVGPGATLSHALIGARVLIHPGVRIGQDGFGFALGAQGHEKVPQLGRVVIEDDVEIGANSAIDRGSGPDTRIGRGTKIDNLVMIAHNVQLGPGCVIAGQSGFAGSTTVGAGSVLAAQVGVAGHLSIGPGVQLAARAGVTRDLPGGQVYGGAPAIPIHDWRRQMAAISRLGKRKGSGHE